MAQKITKKLACGRTVTISGSLKMKEFRRWVKAEEEADLETVYSYLAKLVEEWDFAGLKPDDPTSYDELTISEYSQVASAVGEWLQAELEAKN